MKRFTRNSIVAGALTLAACGTGGTLADIGESPQAVAVTYSGEGAAAGCPTYYLTFTVVTQGNVARVYMGDAATGQGYETNPLALDWRIDTGADVRTFYFTPGDAPGTLLGVAAVSDGGSNGAFCIYGNTLMKPNNEEVE